ncbi:MAG TPA: 3-hydroxyacyl-CoA dehydrogenase NAD-binding domain-containing protein [Desulfomonilaceae bacterium]|nr:3-hydroxyacyl-CoA dehydrogenase NAD-binding domain-containing protein [Desulfomonilaceae bacterium]
MVKPLEKVAIIGTGILGAQIAMLSAHAGHTVKVYDPREEAFLETYNKIKTDLTAKQVIPFIPWEDWERCKTAVQRVTNLDDAVGDAELVIESAPENVQLKNDIFKQLGEKAPREAILATNSSSIPVSKMENSSGRPERCLNIHFYFPLQGVNMVDIMGGTRTLPEVMEKGVEWIASIGCIPLKVNKEILGFCFNRVWRAIKREVLYMWANGFVDFRDTDRAWMIFTKMKEGPFALMDKVGLDVIYDIEMSYYNDSKDPKDKPPDALLDLVKRGELGIKSGKGFYTYPNPEFLQPDFLNPKKEVLP